MSTDPLCLRLGSATIELRTNRVELRLTMSHIYRAFTTEDIGPLPVSMTDVVDGDGFAASIDGCEYHFAEFYSAVYTIKNALADRLLEELTTSLLVHAATVVDDQYTTIVIGYSGSGKTTTALELVRRGMYYVTDEFTAIDGRTIQPFPRSAARKFEGPVPAGVNLEILHDRRYLAYMLPDRRVSLQPIPMQRLRLMFLNRVDNEPASVRSIGPGEACTLLMPSVLGIIGNEAAMWPALASVASSAQCCVLENCDIGRDLDLALDLLRAT